LWGRVFCGLVVLIGFLLALSGCDKATPSPTFAATMTPRTEVTVTLPALETSRPAITPTPASSPSPALLPLTAVPLPLLLATISPQNASRLTQLARWGSDAEVSQIAYSPDGKLLARGIFAGIDLLDSQTGGRVRFIEAPAWSVAFSPDGALLASGWQDGILQLWQVGGCAGDAQESVSGSVEGCGSLLQTLTGHTDAVHSVAFSPDGQFLASGSYDHQVRLWRVDNCLDQIEGSAPGDVNGCGNLLRVLEHDWAVEAVAFGPDGMILASGGWEETIRLWEVGTGNLLLTLEEHGGSVRSLAFRPKQPGDDTNRTILAAGLSDGSVWLWDVDDGGTTLETLTGHYGHVNSVAFSPDGKILASAGDYLDQNVQVWHVGDSASLLRVFYQLNGAVLSLAFHPSGQVLASSVGNPENSVCLWGLVKE
jgi:WD40 repeat protein